MWNPILAFIATQVFSGVLAAGPVSRQPTGTSLLSQKQMECVQFKSPRRLAAGVPFRARLPRGLELRVDGEIQVGPATEPFVDYLWLVSPPLQTAPQRVIGEAYNVTAAQSVAMPRDLRFVTTRADYDRVRALLDGNVPADTYFEELKRLKLGTLSLTVTESSVRGSDIEWLSFQGEGCVPG